MISNQSFEESVTQKPEVVVAGHICLDIIPTLEAPVRIEPGGLVRTGPAALSTGGAVANTGLALFRLGIPVRLLGKVGDDLFGKAVFDLLQTQNPRLVEGMVVSAGEVTSYSIVISPPGIDRSFLHCPGANDTFTADDVSLEQLEGVRLFHFGYPPIMRRMYENRGEQLLNLMEKVSKKGITTSLDLCQPDPGSPAGNIDWQDLLERVLPWIDVFQPSIDELLYMLDRPLFERLVSGDAPTSVFDLDYLENLGARLDQMGAGIVVIKLGNQGLFVHSPAGSKRIEKFCARHGLNVISWVNRSLVQPCFVVDRVAGTTGSGDSTIAGFIGAVLQGFNPEEAARFATAVGACSVEAPDATSGIPSWQAVRHRLESGWANHPSTLVRQRHYSHTDPLVSSLRGPHTGASQ